MMGSRGSTIVMALLIGAVMAVLALGLLQRRIGQRASSNAGMLQARVQALAWAGLEDARVKLMKSRNFPPATNSGGAIFSYSESLPSLANPAGSAGRYMVEVDTTFATKAVIRSTATLTQENAPSLTLRGELDTEPSRESFTLGGGATTESRPFRWIRVEVVDVRAAQ